MRPSICPSVQLSVRPSVRPSISASVHLSVRPSVRPSICPSVHLFIRPSVRQSICPSVHLSVRPSVRPSICPSVHLSVRPSIRPSILPSIIVKRLYTSFNCIVSIPPSAFSTQVWSSIQTMRYISLNNCPAAQWMIAVDISSRIPGMSRMCLAFSLAL